MAFSSIPPAPPSSHPMPEQIPDTPTVWLPCPRCDNANAEAYAQNERLRFHCSRCKTREGDLRAPELLAMLKSVDTEEQAPNA